MPRLLMFAPCERVIIGQDNTASLIVVIQEMKFFGALDKELPPNSRAIAQLSLFSEWYKTPEDDGKTFEQRIVFAAPGGAPVFEALTEFQMTKPFHRVVGTLNVLPILMPIEYHMTLFLREKGETEWGSVAADYPINVVHAAAELPQPQT